MLSSHSSPTAEPRAVMLTGSGADPLHGMTETMPVNITTRSTYHRQEPARDRWFQAATTPWIVMSPQTQLRPVREQPRQRCAPGLSIATGPFWNWIQMCQVLFSRETPPCSRRRPRPVSAVCSTVEGPLFRRPPAPWQTYRTFVHRRTTQRGSSHRRRTDSLICANLTSERAHLCPQG